MQPAKKEKKRLQSVEIATVWRYLEETFNDINQYLFSQLDMDLEHVYIDGSKLEANANK